MLGQYTSRKTAIGMVLLYFVLGAKAQEGDFEKQVTVDRLPIPKEKQQLFYLQRDPDENTLVYQLNMAGETVDPDEPVSVFWIRYAEDGQKKGLNFVQRTMAYGINHKPLGNGDFELRLVSYKTLPLRLSYCKKSKAYRVFAMINDREAILDRIFVRITGGSVFAPDIAYYELSGRDAETFAKLTQRLKP